MKKTVFLIIPVVAILLSGCIGSTGSLFRAGSGSYPFLGDNSPLPHRGENATGLRLFISPRSALNIDVECIFDDVQGDSTFSPEERTCDSMKPLSPWIRMDVSY